jgi:inosose dehydratase
VRSGDLSFQAATKLGLFVPLGRGDAGVAAAMDELARHGYDGWLVLEQDTAISEHEGGAGRQPLADVTESVAFLDGRG